jgi:hypothetical protein
VCSWWRVSTGQCGWEKFMVCSFPYPSSSSAQSPNWPAFKELNISELPAREGLLFYFGEFPQAVRQSHQIPILAPFNLAHCKFKSGVLRYQIQGPLALSIWHLVTAFWGMRNVGLSCFAAGENCCLMISLSGVKICWWHKYCSRTSSAILPMTLLDLPSVIFPSQWGGGGWTGAASCVVSVFFRYLFTLLYISCDFFSSSLLYVASYLLANLIFTWPDSGSIYSSAILLSSPSCILKLITRLHW